MSKGNSAARQENLVTINEKVSYGAYFAGQNIFYILLLTFLTPFYTDMGIPVATVAVITLVVKAWDAVNDPIFGAVVDKVNFKKGKFLPWIKVSLFAIPIATVLLFAIPSGAPLGVKIAWAVIGYMLWDTAYTICDVPIYGIVTTLTDRISERVLLLSIGRICGVVAAIVVSVVVPTVRQRIGGWLPTAIVLSVLALIAMAPLCFAAKERVSVPKTQEDFGFKEMFRFIKGNKYMLIFYAGGWVYGATSIGTGLGMYTARYLLGDESYLAILSLVGIIPMVLAGFLIPVLVKRFDKYTLYMFGFAGAVITYAIAYFVGYSSIPAYLVMLFVRGIPSGFIVMLMFMFTPDCAEYGHYHSGIAAPGISFSIQTFSAKLTAALSTSLGAFALAIIGFVEGEGATQSADFIGKFWNASMLIPLIGLAGGFLILTKYKLRDKYVDIITRCNTGQISKEEADKLLDGHI
ncbi:MAG: glycoside-pentoside-hexuronide (GPH):cation symporter [Clostridiales bacterium]|jgi:probable glucitol transport protein GutA|nr:glycoside-pentoside-hexuronide (GPH):cation symporter [Clostridiales bacterium]